jgi:hypothetical protein
MVVFAHEDVAGGEARKETLDNVTDGFQLLRCNVLLFVHGAPKCSSLDVLVQYRAPSLAGAVRV